MIFALATGTVATAPTRRTTAKGNPFATFNVRVQSGEGSTFVNVAVFDTDLVDDALGLAEGAAITVQGKLELRTWQGRDGAERTSLSITAAQLMPLSKPPPRPRKRSAQGHEASPQPADFGEEAGDLDSVLPHGGTA